LEYISNLLKEYASEKQKNRFYILVGDKEAWNTSLLHNMWGFSDRTKGLWNTSCVGDFMAYYVTSPVSKVVGFGKLTEKFADEKLIWPDEKLFRRPIWKYRIRFDNLILTVDGVPVPSYGA
jgi:hypothetical protein